MNKVLPGSGLRFPSVIIWGTYQYLSKIVAEYIMAYFVIVFLAGVALSLQWRCKGVDAVPNHHPHDCLLNWLFSGDQKEHQSSASLVFVWGIHRWSVNSPQKWPVTRKMFPFDDVTMVIASLKPLLSRIPDRDVHHDTTNFHRRNK